MNIGAEFEVGCPFEGIWRANWLEAHELTSKVTFKV